MNLGKSLAFLLSVIFFIVLVVVFATIVVSFFPGVHFSDNLILRFVCLIIFVSITRRFYNYLRGE
ncbi:hypothetical protein [Methanobrevibacter curvatus]|uniref:hypothetical protein n=1 Tax=Methanobrevibacter curvatus TaxID=49547 RepID=UPI0012EDCA17|nr:hypothetical protein [Methanobrevibacter curvatus]